MLDFKHPDYPSVFRKRARFLELIRAKPEKLEELKAYYTKHPCDFINDWGVTVDPRKLAVGKPVNMPFILFPKQREFLEWLLERWKNGEPGIVVKSRDVGASWLAMALSCTLCLFHKNMMVGVGSAKQDKLDRTGDPDTIFFKARTFIKELPAEFRTGWNEQRDSLFLRLLFPATDSSITGEAGDNIGRGGRKAIYFLDESAHLERPQLVDASLASNTDCRIDISSVNGSANPFAQKARGGKIKRFDFLWTDDPRKDAAWFEKKQLELDPIVLNQEILCDFSASMEGIIIPAIWVAAARDAHIRLKIKPTGAKRGALDVADEGVDRNAFGVRHGNVLTYAESWSGKESDIYKTTERAFLLCDTNALTGFSYDADGLGAGVRGDARKINEHRASIGLKQMHVTPFRASGAVLDPESIAQKTDRKNEDFFENAGIQAAWALRFRFEATYRAVVKGEPFNPDDIISISSDFPEVDALCMELSQPTYGQAKSGKLLLEKKPDGSKSPNFFDCTLQLFGPSKVEMIISPAFLQTLQHASNNPQMARHI